MGVIFSIRHVAKMYRDAKKVFITQPTFLVSLQAASPAMTTNGQDEVSTTWINLNSNCKDDQLTNDSPSCLFFLLLN